MTIATIVTIIINFTVAIVYMNIKAISNIFKSTRILESPILYLEPHGRNGHCRTAGTSILLWVVEKFDSQAEEFGCRSSCCSGAGI